MKTVRVKFVMPHMALFGWQELIWVGHAITPGAVAAFYEFNKWPFEIMEHGQADTLPAGPLYSISPDQEEKLDSYITAIAEQWIRDTPISNNASRVYAKFIQFGDMTDAELFANLSQTGRLYNGEKVKLCLNELMALGLMRKIKCRGSQTCYSVAPRWQHRVNRG